MRPDIIRFMRNTANALIAAIFVLAAGIGLLARQTAPQQPTFRVAVDLVTTDVIVRDQRDQFVSDLKPEEFEVFEDGVQQQIVSLVLTHGGRVFNVQAPPPAPVQEGIMLPAARPTPRP